nr:unnamed protein product [Naegleria fowleri]
MSSHAPLELASLIDKVSRSHQRSKQRAETAEKPVRKIRLAEPVEAEMDKKIDEEIFTFPFLTNDIADHTDDDFRTKRSHLSEIKIKKQKELLERVNFADPKYQAIYKSNHALKPLVHFFKHLIPVKAIPSDQQNVVTKSKLRLSIPYTVVYGIAENPVLYYTDNDGFVARADNISYKTIKQKLTLGTSTDTDVAVVMKRTVTGEVTSNAATLLSVKQLMTVLDTQTTGVCAYQRYVKSCGSKASIARILWSCHKPVSGYVISNIKTTTDMSEKEPSNRLLTSTENINNIDIFQLKTAALRELGEQIRSLVKYLEGLPNLKCKFESLAADFIRDDNGRYWFIQVKAFTLEEKSTSKRPTSFEDESFEEKSVKSRSAYLRCKECKMCLNLFPPSELNYSMTLKMIYATEQHLKRRAVKLSWFDRPEFKGLTETSSWYQEYKVCKPCFDMYIQEQKLAKVELEFAKAIGIPVTKKINDDASIIESLQQKLSKQKRILIHEEHQQPKTLQMYRFIVYLNEVRNVPDILLYSKKIHLKMTIFNTELIVPIKMDEIDSKKKIAVGKLRVFYFFVKNQQQFRQFLKTQREVRVDLCVNTTEVIGKAVLHLRQFESGLLDKLDYMVLFSATGLKLCSLRATLGFVQMSTKDVSHIKLQEWIPGVFIPPSDFYTADPLPEEWMELIPTLKTTNDSQNEDPKPLSARRPQSASLANTSGTGEKRPLSSTFTKRPATPSQTLTRRASQSAQLTKPPVPSYAKQIGNLKKRPQSSGPRVVYNGLPSNHDPLDYSTSPMTAQDLASLAWLEPPQKQPAGLDMFTSNVNQKEVVTPHDVAVTRSPIEARVQYAQDEVLWEMTINQVTIKDLKSSVDECWILTIDFFGVLKKEYESFQLFSEGPLVFHIENATYFSASRENLNAFLEKERILKVSLRPKYLTKDEIVAFMDLRQLLKRENAQIFFEASLFDQSHAEEIKCSIVGEESDQESDEEDNPEAPNRDNLKLGTLTTYISYSKVAKTSEAELNNNVPSYRAEEYKITCFASCPLQDDDVAVQ